jgi:glycerophosphoryl diester phosphodiesterase
MTRPAPILFAHRGASGYLPENTLEAFELALRQGATGLESDAWLSADGIPVLVHDRTIRPPGRRIDVTRRRADELAEYGVPRLAELYTALGTDFELSLDLEHAAVARPALEVASAVGAAGRLWACHEDPDVLADLRSRSGDVRLVCTTGPQPIRDWLPTLLERLVAIPVDCLNMRWSVWTAGRVERVHAAGLLAFGWDAQTPASVSRLVELGIDALYADHPDRLVAAFAEAAGG